MARNSTPKKKVVFLTSTRADFGKIKSLISAANNLRDLEVHIFATGMHMLKEYDYTVNEIEKCGFPNIYKFINHTGPAPLGEILANTLHGLGNFVREFKPDLILVHGDRVEALAGALAGALNNILVGHIEGGEVSGTIDEHIRHAVSKMSHLHFVSNDESRRRLIQMGEANENIYVIGSPDLDIMNSSRLPSLRQAAQRYSIPFTEFGIFIYHPVTTELEELRAQINVVIDVLVNSKMNFVVIHPNNDPGADVIKNAYNKKLSHIPRFKIFPSMRFEYFLALLKRSHFIIGNSSAGIKEAPFYGVPTIDIGTRQMNRIRQPLNGIFKCDYKKDHILSLINKLSKEKVRFELQKNFGSGDSHRHFIDILKNGEIWNKNIQKQFLDVHFS